VNATTTCPYCGSSEIELVSPWGGQIITSQLRCISCNSYFEAIRDDFEKSAGRDKAGDS
jgi:C4-type Zn-finger protein